jgi:hypothetical protein
MSIAVQSIIDSCQVLLDAEDSDRYKFDNDFKTSINLAQRWLVNLYNKLFGLNQVTEESLLELTVVRCFKLSNYSRLSFPVTGVGVTEVLDNAAAVNLGGGLVKIPCTDHVFNLHDWVEISETTNYDGTWQILDLDDDTFTIAATFVVETFAGTETAFKGDKLWRVITVYPEITTIPASPVGLPADADQSSFLDDVSMAEPLRPAASRLTLEEWGKVKTNPMLPGSSLGTNTEMRSYAYINFTDYNVDTYLLEDADYELQVIPDRSNEIVGLAFLRMPRDVTVETDYIPFPESYLNW